MNRWYDAAFGRIPNPERKQQACQRRDIRGNSLRKGARWHVQTITPNSLSGECAWFFGDHAPTGSKLWRSEAGERAPLKRGLPIEPRAFTAFGLG